MESVRDELDSTGSESKNATEFCTAVNEISDATICGKFLD
jgi:hypothetical protein